MDKRHEKFIISYISAALHIQYNMRQRSSIATFIEDSTRALILKYDLLRINAQVICDIIYYLSYQKVLMALYIH